MTPTLIETDTHFLLKGDNGAAVKVSKETIRDNMVVFGADVVTYTVLHAFETEVGPEALAPADKARIEAFIGEAKAKNDALATTARPVEPAKPPKPHAWDKPNGVPSFALIRDGIEVPASQVPYGAFFLHDSFGLCVRLNPSTQELPVQVVDRKFASFAVDPDDVVLVDDRISLPPGDE